MDELYLSISAYLVVYSKISDFAINAFILLGLFLILLINKTVVFGNDGYSLLQIHLDLHHKVFQLEMYFIKEELLDPLVYVGVVAFERIKRVEQTFC